MQTKAEPNREISVLLIRLGKKIMIRPITPKRTPDSFREVICSILVRNPKRRTKIGTEPLITAAKELGIYFSPKLIKKNGIAAEESPVTKKCFAYLR
ncbi:MAG: hypothetical protein Tsb0015_02420 [Simkaniaceae bacterium]